MPSKPSKQSGFTIIELIVVIVLIGILSAVALPRFLDLTDDAHVAAVEGVGGAFRSGVTLFHANWLAKGSPTTDPNRDNLADFGDGTLDANTAGYPSDSGGNNSTADVADCIEIWDGVLQAGAPTAAAAGADYNVTYDATNCTYTYAQQTNLSITYNHTTGAITVDNTP